MSASAQLLGRSVVRWGILGCGDVTEVKSGPGFQKATGSALVAVMRRQGALAADYARRHGVPRWYDDARRLIEDREVDAVYIATPPGAHLDLARLVAAAGKPCYVEKPMARNATECDAMIEAFRTANQKLFVAYYRRAQPRFLKLRELLERGVLGRLTNIGYRMSSPLPANADPTQGNWRLDARVSGGGLILDVGSHVLDILDFLLGPLGEARGLAAHLSESGSVEDSVTMTFRTATGVPGAASWNFASAVKEDVLEFTGPLGRLSLSVFGPEPIRLITGDQVESHAVATPAHVAQPLIQTVVDDLLGRGTCPSTGDSARRTSAILDAVLNDYYGGRTDEFWSRPTSWPGLQI